MTRQGIRPPSRFIHKGSAYIIVIGSISVLIIILLGYFRSNTSRHFSARLMSNEKRAEALAEASVDLVLRYIKDKMNEHADPNIYPYFRFPAPISGDGKLGNPTGVNAPLTLSAYPASLTFDMTTPGLEAINSMVQELGGSANVKTLKIDCGISQAEAFTSKKDGYAVPGINVKTTAAQGPSAQFLDDIGNAAQNAGTVQTLLGKMDFTFNLPSPLPTPVGATNEHSIDVTVSSWIGPRITAKVVLKKETLVKATANLYVKAEIWLPLPRLSWETVYTLEPPDPKAVYEIDFEQVFKQYINLGAAPLSIDSILEKSMPGTNKSLSWSALVFHAAIQAGWNRISALQSHKATAFGSNPEVVEKGGILRIKAEVEFFPNGTNGQKIRRVLVADREFKVSDIQPPAPEYSFFVANSNALIEPGDAVPGVTLGPKINWDAGLATISIHNLPRVNDTASADYKACDGFAGGDSGADSKCQIPGMIRINSNARMEMNTFLGTISEPELTEYNAMGERGTTKPFLLTPTFQWSDKASELPRDHEIDFPVVRHTDVDFTPYDPVGVTSLKNILSFCDALSAPTLLYGTGHFEYPLGIRAEANMDMKYGNLRVLVNPRGHEEDPKDRTQIFIYYNNLKKPFGLPDHPSYTGASDWDTTTPGNMPPNLYSLLQYAKKATHFYESEGEFFADTTLPVADGGRNDGGIFDCTGVTYIKGDLNISANPWKVKGHGIIVAKGNITISGDILREGADTVFSLIARRGGVLINSPCRKIQAALYSNSGMQNSAGNMLEIDGNLVMNECLRDDLNSLQVHYNSAACRLTPMSVMRDIGKFEPKRYIVSVGKQWSRFIYEKQ
ncbi:MAG: hypothetical protein WA705_11590 [Candidatus Ozemobacteraceae bacterium]